MKFTYKHASINLNRKLKQHHKHMYSYVYLCLQACVCRNVRVLLVFIMSVLLLTYKAYNFIKHLLCVFSCCSPLCQLSNQTREMNECVSIRNKSHYRNPPRPQLLLWYIKYNKYLAFKANILHPLLQTSVQKWQVLRFC